MSIIRTNDGRYSITGLSEKEISIVLKGVEFVQDRTFGAPDDDSLPDWGGLETEDHFTLEMTRTKVTCGEANIFCDLFWEKYDQQVHKIQTTKTFVANTNPPL